ncbi:hypothetical protein EV702DRAFT_720599 [Suillus placidus]|uniref:Uncharacterized protein n=1 Tax=Suillus placidus TaxID=48579 RepID=A0A9P6ZL48_9AGAM|nr:hypothetical protein EV702DRAFT_720599 [Suillus placidus]
MISSAMTITARVVVTDFLTVSCFKRVVVNNTAQILSKAEKASTGLAVYSVCLSTITLVLAADKAAQRILSNEAKHMPAASKGDNVDCNPLSSNANTATTLKLLELSHLQPSPSPSQSRLIESTEKTSAPISTCTPNDNTAFATPKHVELSYLQSSPSPSQLRLIESTETISAPITYPNTCTPCITLTSPDLYCKRLSIDSNTTLVAHDDDSVSTDVFLDSDDALDTDNCELFGDDIGAVHEDDCSETLDIPIAKMTALDDPHHPPKLRPLILVTNRETASTTAYRPLPQPTYSMDALARSMEALSLSDRPSSTSRLKPLLLVTKCAIGQLKDPPPTNTPPR